MEKLREEMDDLESRLNARTEKLFNKINSLESDLEDLRRDYYRLEDRVNDLR